MVFTFREIINYDQIQEEKDDHIQEVKDDQIQEVKDDQIQEESEIRSTR